MLIFAKPHFFPFQEDSRIKAKDLSPSILHFPLPSRLSLSFSLAFVDPFEEWSLPFPWATKEIDLSACACPKGVGPFFPIGVGQEMEQAYPPHTSGTRFSNCPPSKLPSGLANNGKQKVCGHFTFIREICRYLTGRLFRESL